MTDNPQLLQNVLDQPGDDAPRLVYADWLEELGGDPDRAEFIRIQCELAKLDELDEGYWPLKRREETLWATHQKAWEAPIKQFGKQFEFRRGFPERISLRANIFLERAKDLFATAPIRHVKFREAKDDVEKLAKFEPLGKLSSVSFNFCALGTTRIAKLLESPYLRDVESLDLGNNALSSGVVGILAKWKPEKLKTLILDSAKMQNANFEPLATTEWFAQLETLHVHSCELRASNLESLFGLGVPLNLKRLELQSNILGDPEAEVLANAESLRELESLMFGPPDSRYRDQDLTSEGIKELVTSKKLANLRSLQLDGQEELGVEGLEVLAGRTRLTKLECLSLYKCRFVRRLWWDEQETYEANAAKQLEVLERFVRSPLARRLKQLIINGNDYGNAEIAVIAGASGLRKLVSLYVDYPKDGKSLSGLIKASKLKNLRVLNGEEFPGEEGEGE